MRAVTMVAVVLAAVILGSPSSTFAGPLVAHPDSLVTSDTAPFNDGLGTSGVVEYAVLTAADFNEDFSGLGYVPTDALVYAYQIRTAGPRTVLGLTIEVLFGSAHTIGSFKLLNGIPPSSAQFIDIGAHFADGDAQWLFNDGLHDGEFTAGLIFSSPFMPVFAQALILPDYSDLPPNPPNATTIILPVPGNVPAQVPEPGSLALLGLGLAGFSWSRRRK